MINEFRGKYFFLSNFFSSPMLLDDGSVAPTVEHLFQSLKATSEEERLKILSAESASEAKYLGRHCKLREDWENIKDDVMYFCLRKKFIGNPDLTQKLLDTGDEELVEGNNWGDKYWGKVKGIGKNKLGQLLMKVREELKNV